MDGKKHFRVCCEAYHIDCQATFQLGAQNSKRADRWEYKCSTQSRKPSQQYAVCYFPAGNFYAAWNLNAPKAASKTVFSVKKDEVPLFIHGQITLVNKAIEHQNGFEENVFIFSPDGVNDFLQHIAEVVS